MMFDLSYAINEEAQDFFELEGEIVYEFKYTQFHISTDATFKYTQKSHIFDQHSRKSQQRMKNIST